MNTRQKKMFQYLLDQNDFVTVQHIADEFHVSLRTAHNDIAEIQELLQSQNVQFIKKPKVGVKIDASLSERKMLLNMIDVNKETVDVLSTKIRRLKILSELLMHNEGTSLNKLSEEYLVSKTSIVSDLEIIETMLPEYNLQLIRDRKGTRISGKEEDIRHALSRVANDFVQLDFEEEEREVKESRLDLSTYYRLKNIFDIENIESIEHILYQAQEQLGYTINDISYVNLLTHLLILIKRMTEDMSSLSNEEAEQVYCSQNNDHSYQIAQYIADEISKIYHISIDSSEVQYIHQYLVCSGIQSDFIHLNLDNYQIHVNDECIHVVNQMISFVSDAIHCDLKNDKELQLSLITHIIPLLQRVKYHIELENPLLEEIKVQYSAMFSIVTLAIEMMNNESIKHLNEDEIGFLTIHFQAAVERSMQQKQVIIVCPEGIGFSRLIAHRIERFISSIHIVDIVSLAKLKDMDLSSIDFIISTIPIKDCPKKVVIVSSFITELDISSLNNFLVENARTSHVQHYENLSQIIDESVVYTNVDMQNKEDVLRYVCSKLEEHQYVTPSYIETVLQREEIMSTDLGNGVAIPHGNEKEILVPKIVIVTLKQPICWKDNQVSILFLIAVNMDNPQWTKNILKDLYAIIDNKKMLQTMIHATDKQEILELFHE